MRDSLGGLVNIAIVTVFIVVTLGYLAFNVNYTKAFRMKNKIIDVVTEYGGVDKCSRSSSCVYEIEKYADSIGYTHDSSLKCDVMSAPNLAEGYRSDYAKVYKQLFCYQTIRKTCNNCSQEGEYFYERIATKVDVDVPIIRNFVANIRYFYITGETKLINANAKEYD